MADPTKRKRRLPDRNSQIRKAFELQPSFELSPAFIHHWSVIKAITDICASVVCVGDCSSSNICCVVHVRKRSGELNRHGANRRR